MTHRSHGGGYSGQRSPPSEYRFAYLPNRPCQHPNSPSSYAYGKIAFTYRGKKYTYNRLPQGYKDSPGLFNLALNQILKTIQLAEGVVLIQYVDDCLIAARTAEESLHATKQLLTTLADAGFKVKREKCQIT